MPNHAMDLWCLLEQERYWEAERGSHSSVLSIILDQEQVDE